MRASKRRVVIFAMGTGLLWNAAAAAPQQAEAGATQPAAQDRVVPFAPVQVVGVTPLSGGEVPARLLPYDTQSVDGNGADNRWPLDALARAVPAIGLSAAQNNPFQPDLQFRGFVASPLLGLPQGIAVYVDGVRVNEAFGDTVNWDLLPLRAVATTALVPGTDPVYGRNALGGAIAFRTKDGFGAPETRVGVEAGSFGRRTGWAETGGNDGPWGWYATADAMTEDGWRTASPTSARHALANVSRHGESVDLLLSLSGAHTRLVGNGATPVEELRRDWRAAFTTPDETRNRFASALFRAGWQFGGGTVTAAVHRRSVDALSFNGDTRDSEPCDDAPQWLCDDDAPVLDTSGEPVPSTYDAVANRGATRQRSDGLSLQGAFAGLLAGRPNRFVAGAERGFARIRHASDSRASALAPDRSVPDGHGPMLADAALALRATTSAAALYASDTWEASSRLAVTLSARYDKVRSRIRDDTATQPDLDGDHRFSRLDPAFGLVWTLRVPVQFNAAWGESMRAPTAVELTCADEDAPCRLPNAFVADPPLRQVVARHWEMGLRSDAARSQLQWHALLFRSVNADDVLFQATGGSASNQGFFANVGDTRRQGLELAVQDARESRSLHWNVSFVLLDATYLTGFTEASANHPDADDDGLLEVPAGSRIPGLARHALKAGFDFAATGRLTFGADGVAASGMYLRGDEANRLPRTGGYATVDAYVRWKATPALSVSLRAENLFNRRYTTFGVLGEAGEVFPDDEDPRFLGPAPPRGVWLGIDASL